MIRVRGPLGLFTVSLADIEEDLSSVTSLTAMLKKKSGMVDEVEVLSGYPPALLLSFSDLKGGDTLILRAVPLPSPHPHATSPSSHQEAKRVKVAISPSIDVSQTSGGGDGIGSGGDEEEDAELALALEASLAKPPGKETAGELSEPPVAKVAPTAIRMGDGSFLARRIVDADNSCLFNSIGYVCLDHNKTKANDLREIVAAAIKKDPFTYNEGVLEGKSTEEYCQWIKSSQKWGGPVELSILSLHFKVEIAAFDIRTKRMDIYSSDLGFKERVFVIYDGLHYDPLALALFDGSAREIDVTVFPSPDHAESAEAREEGSKLSTAALQLVTEIHEARQFTDMANFTLRCGTCQVGLKGEAEAVVHAKQTGHANFQEY